MSWITKTDVKGMIGTTSTDYDTIIDNLIDYVEGAFKKMAYDLASEEITETEYINDCDRFVLQKYPVTEISSFNVFDTEYGTDQITNISYIVDSSAGIIYFNTKLSGKLVVKYTAGYSTIPSDVKFAVIMQVIDFLKQKDRLGLVSKGKAGESTAYNDSPWLPLFLDVVERYKNVATRRIDI